MAVLRGFLQNELVIRHAHMACGIGGGAKGFNRANPRVGNLRGRFECAGGIDVDAAAIREFERQTGVKGTVLDLFSREQYVAFHGRQPPADWREATPADVHRAYGANVHVAFASMPCKGFSGLLSQKQSETDKYQALNGLTLRGIWLLLEAYKDDPIGVILFENVPRIRTRGRWLLDQIIAILRSYGYHVHEDDHDCGELGNLAQSRSRFLLIARHPVKVPPLVYQPTKHRLRSVGEVIGKLPLPGDPVAGVMHRVPALQWQTWVRLAFVPAGRDWRALNDLRVENGVLADFGIVPETPLRDGALGVHRWSDTAGVVIGNQRSPLHGRHAVADPRVSRMHNEGLGVRGWHDRARVVASASRPANGAHSVADPRPGYPAGTHQNILSVVAFDGSAKTVSGAKHPAGGALSVADPRPNAMMRGGLGVLGFEQPSGVVAGETMPTNGTYAVADPRPGYGPATHAKVLGVTAWEQAAGVISSTHITGGAMSVADPRLENGHPRSVQLGVRPWGKPSSTVKGKMDVGQGPYAVADPRPTQANQTFQQYGVQAWRDTSIAVSGQASPGGGPYSVADPRLAGKPRFNNTFRIVAIDDPARAVAGPGGPAGGQAVADPRPAARDYSSRKYKVTAFGMPSRAVIGASTTGDGAFAVADPRCTWGANSHRNKLKVARYGDSSPTVAGADRVGSGAPSVADARREHYQTCGHYGVVSWAAAAGVVSATIGHDNGAGSVADPRDVALAVPPVELPQPKERLVCRIISTDDTWHRPFTTLELAALQSLIVPEEVFEFDAGAGRWLVNQEFELGGRSDAARREWIGNMVPPLSATAIAEEIGEALLLAHLGETFTLSSKQIWVSPVRAAMAIDQDQVAFRWDAQ